MYQFKKVSQNVYCFHITSYKPVLGQLQYDIMIILIFYMYIVLISYNLIIYKKRNINFLWLCQFRKVSQNIYCFHITSFKTVLGWLCYAIMTILVFLYVYNAYNKQLIMFYKRNIDFHWFFQFRKVSPNVYCFYMTTFKTVLGQLGYAIMTILVFLHMYSAYNK